MNACESYFSVEQQIFGCVLFKTGRFFNGVSKVIRDCFGFASLRSMIGAKNSRRSLNQSDAKLKPITTWSFAFSRALGSLLGFTSSSLWFLKVFSKLLIGCCDNFGFRSTTLNRSMLYEPVIIHCFTLTSFRQQQTKIDHLLFGKWLESSEDFFFVFIVKNFLKH